MLFTAGVAYHHPLSETLHRIGLAHSGLEQKRVCQAGQQEKEREVSVRETSLKSCQADGLVWIQGPCFRTRSVVVSGMPPIILICTRIPVRKGSQHGVRCQTWAMMFKDWHLHGLPDKASSVIMTIWCG